MQSGGCSLKAGAEEHSPSAKNRKHACGFSFLGSLQCTQTSRGISNFISGPAQPRNLAHPASPQKSTAFSHRNQLS
jgi:hypothetical protein